MQNINEKALAVTAEVSKAVLGKPEVVLKIMMAILARGHVLIEDIPGVGKTTLAQAFARAMDLTQNRVQFTPDVLPSDIVGFSLYQKETGKFVYHPGAVMCNLFLADEINRTSARTQSALLEVMEESAVTVDGVTRVLPQPPNSFPAAVYRFCNGKPRRLGGYADAAGIPAGPLYGLRGHGLPRCGGGNGDFVPPAAPRPAGPCAAGDGQKRPAGYAAAGRRSIYER